MCTYNTVTRKQLFFGSNDVFKLRGHYIYRLASDVLVTVQLLSSNLNTSYVIK